MLVESGQGEIFVGGERCAARLQCPRSGGDGAGPRPSVGDDPSPRAKVGLLSVSGFSHRCRTLRGFCQIESTAQLSDQRLSINCVGQDDFK